MNNSIIFEIGANFAIFVNFGNIHIQIQIEVNIHFLGVKECGLNIINPIDMVHIT